MKKIASLALAAALVLAAGSAAADCAAVFKSGAKFHIVEKQVGGERPMTVTVTQNEKGYVKLDLSVDKTKQKFSMPGHVEGDTAFFAGAQRPLVWMCTCGGAAATCTASGPQATGSDQIKLELGK